MFSKQSAERFEKDRLIEDPTPGPGAYHLPSAVDGKGAILEVSERWSESAEEEKLESNLSPLSPPFTRTPTPARGRDEKENRVPLSARCGSPRTWSTPATQPTPKKAATPGGWTPGPAVAPGCEDRRQRDLRLASKLDMVRDELRQKSKEAKELQLALTAKDRKIEDLSKKIEELAADRREAHRRTLEAENELCAKRRQLHEKEQEVVALQRKLEHARLARKEWSKHAEKREEEQRNMQNEMLRMQQSVENLQEKLVTSERDQQMAEQTLRQQQRHSSDLEAGFQAHIEVLEEQIARETCRRKDLEERQARDEAERARWDSALKGSERRCEELQGQVLKLEIELKSRVSSETSFTELRTKLEATSSSLQSSEASREELTRQVAKCSQQLQASNEELSSLKTQRAALEDEWSYKEHALMFVDRMFAYDLGPVLFKPAEAKKHPFRLDREGALAYYRGMDENYPEDTGFALRPWVRYDLENSAVILQEKTAFAMGNYLFEDADGGTTEAQYTFGYVKDEEGALRIHVFMASIPADGEDLKFAQEPGEANLTEMTMEAAQLTWAKKLVEVGNRYVMKGDYHEVAEELVDECYAFSLRPTLFKPAEARLSPFRTSRAGAVSYFAGGDKNFPEDWGFALRPWKSARLSTEAAVIHGTQGLVMGHAYFDDALGIQRKAEFAMGNSFTPARLCML